VLIKEFQAIGLNVVPVGATLHADATETIVEEKETEKIEAQAKELQMTHSRQKK
jgi:hypothetical protein